MTQQSDYDEEIARLDSLKDTAVKLEGAVRVDAVISRAPRDVFSLRISADELSELATAARIEGQNLSEFIRTAALRQAREASGEGRQWLEPPVAAALDELVKRVQEQRGDGRKRRAS